MFRALFNQRDINIHVGINDTPFSYASVDFPRAAALCRSRRGVTGAARWRKGASISRVSWGIRTRALQYVTVANFRGQLLATGNSGPYLRCLGSPECGREGGYVYVLDV